MNPERAAFLAEMLRALAHPIRLSIVELLCRGEADVTTIAAQLAVPQPIISQQLRILRMSRLANVSRQHGRSVYQLAEPRMRHLLKCLMSCAAS
jgi:ArsR family transcriptional regulator